MKKPNKMLPILCAVIGILLPFLCAFLMPFFEVKREEAIASGFILGSALGAVMGILSLILNRKHKLMLVKILGVIDIVPICMFILMFAAYFSYGAI